MLTKILTFLIISLVVTLALATLLILSQRPGKPMRAEAGLDFSKQMARDVQALPVGEVAMRDGFAAQVRHVPGPEGAPLLVLIHGSGWFGAQFDGLARELSNVAEVVVPDLRGHGFAPGRRGDLAYMGQFEDDIADLISHYADDGQRVVLAGHSSGGGLVIRFSGGAERDLIDAAVLLAPFVQYDAPTARENSGGWARVMTRRIIGLSILNTFRIHAFDHLSVIEFAMPQAVLDGPLGGAATTSYSWRLNQSFAPRRDWKGDISKLPPFLLIAGDQDEAFKAEVYQPTFEAINDTGQYLLVPGVGHLPVVDDPRSAAAIAEFVRGNP